MSSTIRLGESRAQVPQLQKVELGEHGHFHEVESCAEVGHEGYPIDQHSNEKFQHPFLAVSDVKFFHSCCCCCCCSYSCSCSCWILHSASSFFRQFHAV